MLGFELGKAFLSWNITSHGFRPPPQRLTWRAKRGRHSSIWCPALFAVCLVYEFNKSEGSCWCVDVVLMKCHFNKFNIFHYYSICSDMFWLFHTPHINPEWNHHDSAWKWQPMLDLNSHRWWMCGSTPLAVTTGPSFERIHWCTDQPWYQALSTNPILSKNHPFTSTTSNNKLQLPALLKRLFVASKAWRYSISQWWHQPIRKNLGKWVFT